MLLAIEGIDGTGKSGMVKWIRENATTVLPGREVLTSYEPTHRQHGARLRAAMTGKSDESFTPDEELELFLLDREDHVTNVIQPALDAGKVVVLDRYFYSNIAYQGARGFDKELLHARNLLIAPKPDLLLILDIPVDEALRRVGVRGETKTIYEQQDMLQSCRETFLSFDGEPGVEVVPATGTIDEVRQRVGFVLLAFLTARNNSNPPIPHVRPQIPPH
jgi:dTMP kinase